MTNVPIRSITISDFRRLSGTRTFPLDAPIVLIHGSNGAGKTSVLSALELGLTGQIRSLKRQDPRYIAHLPSVGHEFATVNVEIDPSLEANSQSSDRITAGGDSIAGVPSLLPETSNFYGERCYLDQASLGRLLEIYQYREGKQESALAKFVNELLGLEQLDAIRIGLSDANNLRSLKKLAERLEVAAGEARRAALELDEATRNLKQTSFEVDQIRATARTVAQSLGVDPPRTLSPVAAPDPAGDDTDEHLVRAIRSAVADLDLDSTRAHLLTLERDLVALGGRMEATAELASSYDLAHARDQLDEARLRSEHWRVTEGPAIEAWQEEARMAGVVLVADPGEDVDRALKEVLRIREAQEATRIERDAAQSRNDDDQRLLEALEERLRVMQEHATALVEGLASVRQAVLDDVCPVCDRDYGEVGSGQLSAHVDAKIAQLSVQGQQLLDLRREREALLEKSAQNQAELAKITATLFEPPQLRNLEDRIGEITRLRDRWRLLSASDESGTSLITAERKARILLEEIEASSTEMRIIRNELSRCSNELGVELSDSEPSREIWGKLCAEVELRLEWIVRQIVSRDDGTRVADQLHNAIYRRGEDIAQVANAAQRKTEWEACIKEGQRRQSVARAVFASATSVRASIVERVFTQSLNRVWMNLFSLLAPDEGFIPTFDIPTESKSGLELTLCTVHRDGGHGGSPQMMLSAGNLNSAAVSLFLALHLAVEPMIPCLVFDDPVQAMDEVHISQFAGLIRVLAKQHERQVVIAVHERELFDYLTLELSPAYEGDELITIELGERELDDDRGIRRYEWVNDAAIVG